MEELIHEADLIADAWFAREAVSATDHSHDLEALDCRRRRLHGLEASRRLDDLLQRPMVRLDDVVQVFRCPVPRLVRQLAVTLEPPDRFRVRAELIRGDGGWWPVPHSCQCLR